eukprot:GGOE01003084.1.p1 GENE.GGOE01003084.1~~GGOE01003084.1.p1  ORF type:complete len:1172 (-),score=249.28 GGOE01003084.1:565-3846(-)
MSPVGKSATSIAPSVSDVDLSRQTPSVVDVRGGRDPLLSAGTESIFSQETAQGPSMSNFIEDLEREAAAQHSNYHPPTKAIATQGPSAPTHDRSQAPATMDSLEYKLQSTATDASPARQSQSTQVPSPTPTLEEVEEALHHLLHSSAYLSQSLGTNPMASPATANRRKAQLFLTTAAVQCAQRNENPSPDSSTSLVMEKLQDLCTAVRGFDTWDLEQAILNLDFSVPDPQLPPPFQLDINLTSPPPRPSPLQRPTNSASGTPGLGRPTRSQPTPTSASARTAPPSANTPQTLQRPASSPAGPRTNPVGGLQSREAWNSPAFRGPASSPQGTLSPHGAVPLLNHSPPEIDQNGSAEFPREVVPPAPVPMPLSPHSSSLHSPQPPPRGSDSAPSSVASAPTARAVEIFRCSSTDTWDLPDALPVVGTASEVWASPNSPNLMFPHHVPSPPSTHQDIPADVAGRSSRQAPHTVYSPLQVPAAVPSTAGKSGPLSFPRSPPTPATAPRVPSPGASRPAPAPPSNTDTSVQCAMSFNDSANLRREPPQQRPQCRRRSLSSPVLVDVATSPDVTASAGVGEIAELRERQHFLLQLTSQIQQQLLMVTTTTNMRFAAQDSEGRHCSSGGVGSRSQSQAPCRRSAMSPEAADISTNVEMFEHHHHHHIITCEGGDPTECWAPATLGLSTRSHPCTSTKQKHRRVHSQPDQPTPHKPVSVATAPPGHASAAAVRRHHAASPPAALSDPEDEPGSSILEESQATWGESPPAGLVLVHPLCSPDMEGQDQDPDHTADSAFSETRVSSSHKDGREVDIIRTLQQQYRNDSTLLSQVSKQTDARPSSSAHKTSSALPPRPAPSSTSHASQPVDGAQLHNVGNRSHRSSCQGDRGESGLTSRADGASRVSMKDLQQSPRWPIEATLLGSEAGSRPEPWSVSSPDLNVEEARRQLRYSSSGSRPSARLQDTYTSPPLELAASLMSDASAEERLRRAVMEGHSDAPPSHALRHAHPDGAPYASDSSLYRPSGEDLSATTDTCSSCMRALQEEMSEGMLDREPDSLLPEACSSCCTDVVAKKLEAFERRTFQRNAQRHLARLFQNPPLGH